jgi:hypothetical protein
MGLLYLLGLQALTAAEGPSQPPGLSIYIVGGHKPATYDFGVIKDSK